MSRYLILAARLVGIFCILFLSSFALDVFGTGAPLGDTIVALVIHLMPSLIVLALLTLAWRFALPGGVIFVLLGLVPFVFLDNPIPANAMLGLPFLVSGGLFIAGGLAKD